MKNEEDQKSFDFDVSTNLNSMKIYDLINISKYKREQYI